MGGFCEKGGVVNNSAFFTVDPVRGRGARISSILYIKFYRNNNYAMAYPPSCATASYL